MATPEGLQDVRVRMAPSPTGLLHIGSVRTALFNWLFARHHGGKFILRIEDTDAERSRSEHETDIIEGLCWAGIDWDEGPDVGGPYAPYRQSERKAIYRKYLEQLIASRHAYYCYCTKEELDLQRQSLESAGLAPKYSGYCRDLAKPPAGRSPEVIRFRVPESLVRFHDLIRGSVEFDAALFGDIVIAKDLDSPLYNFSVVVDDFEMKISHVIRGEEHLANTPKQILIGQALGFPQPAHGHIPLILNENRSKLSKRTNQASFNDYRARGYLPEALMNFMALLGWHPKGNQEIMDREKLIKEFDIKRVQKAGAIFNVEKLDWLNGQYLKKLSIDDLAERLMPMLEAHGIKTDSTFLKKVIEIERERMRILSDFIGSALFYFKTPEYNASLLTWKEDCPEKTFTVLKNILNALESIEGDMLEKEILMNALDPLVQMHGRGSVLWPMRAALSGQRTSPDPFAIAEVLGKKETLSRIKTAVMKLDTKS
ncbi:MAG: glutamate--tRNA ligase [Candidatus Liptonbacteria bacterium]